MVVTNKHFVGAGHIENPATAAEHLFQQEANPACVVNIGSANSKEESSHAKEFDLQKRYRAQ